MKKRRYGLFAALLLSAALLFCGCSQDAPDPTEIPETTVNEEALREEQYSQANWFYHEKQYEEAAKIYEELGDQEKLTKTLCALATETAAAGDLDAALTQLEPVGDTEEAQKLIQKLVGAELIALSDVEEPDTERILALAALIENKSFMTGWDYNEVNNILGSDAIIRSDYEAAAQHYSRCEYEGDREYVPVFELILAEDYFGAAQMIQENGVWSPEYDTGKNWLTIIYERMGEPDKSTLDGYFLDRQMRSVLYGYADEEETMDPNGKIFDDWSFMTTISYVGEISDYDPDMESYRVIEDIDALYAQCGTEPNGKVLILREQQDYPRDGVHYAVDLGMMNGSYLHDGLYSSLYPASLSEVEYVMIVSYDYDHVRDETLVTTTTYGDGTKNETKTQVAFLRLRSQVTLKNVVTGEVIYQSSWVKGGSQPNAYGGNSNDSENPWVSGDMPDCFRYICAAAEKVKKD